MLRRVPFNLVTGFLGSGKTTLINSWLSREAFANTAVIVNEIGQLGVDHRLLDTSAESIALLANGCVCCALRSDLPDAIARLDAAAQQYGTAGFDRVLLETSGLADPAPVIMSLLSDPALAARFRLDSVIAAVDSVHFPMQLRGYPETAAQIALADRLVVTKTDCVSPEVLIEVEALLRSVNPGAMLCSAQAAADSPAALFNAGLFHSETQALQAGSWLRHETFSRPTQHSSGICSFVVEYSSRCQWVDLAAWLSTLLSLQGENILRIKGIVWLADMHEAVAVHAVHHQLHAPAALPAASASEPNSILVFITRGLSREQITESMQSWGLIKPPIGAALL